MSEKQFIYRNFLEEEVEKRFTEEYDEEWGIYLSDNLTGDWYNINPVHIVDTCNKLWEQVIKLREENEKLKSERRNDAKEFSALFRQNMGLKRDNEQLRKIGVMYQGHNPCSNCVYCLENKVCCAISTPIFCDDEKKNFIQGLCKKHKQIQKSNRRYDDE